MSIIIKKLVWDTWNIAHIARHNVLANEVEEVCRGTYRSYESYDGRFEIIGATEQKRILLIVLDPEVKEGEYYVVTAHTAGRKDRALFLKETIFRKEKGGEVYDTKEK